MKYKEWKKYYSSILQMPYHYIKEVGDNLYKIYKEGEKMKYGVLTNFLHDWALLKIKPNLFNHCTYGKVVFCSEDSPWHVDQESDFWVSKQIKLISNKQAFEIIKNKHYQFKKLVVDFDDTLFSGKLYPKVGKQKLIHKLVASYVRYKHKKGWVVILNTLREKGKGLEEAIKACELHNIPIDLYNENYKPDIERWGESRKIGATLSIDDTQVGLIGFLLRMFK